MDNRFHSKDLGVILNDLKQSATLPCEAVLVNNLECRMEKAAADGKREFRYDSQPVLMKPLLEALLVSLLLERESGLNVQLHVPPETTAARADPFFLKEILMLLFHYLSDQLPRGLVSIYLTRGEENCIIEIQSPAVVSSQLSLTVITLCHRLMADMHSELVYTDGGEPATYFSLKLPLVV